MEEPAATRKDEEVAQQGKRGYVKWALFSIMREEIENINGASGL